MRYCRVPLYICINIYLCQISALHLVKLPHKCGKIRVYAILRVLSISIYKHLWTSLDRRTDRRTDLLLEDALIIKRNYRTFSNHRKLKKRLPSVWIKWLWQNFCTKAQDWKRGWCHTHPRLPPTVFLSCLFCLIEPANCRMIIRWGSARIILTHYQLHLILFKCRLESLHKSDCSSVDT